MIQLLPIVSEYLPLDEAALGDDSSTYLLTSRPPIHRMHLLYPTFSQQGEGMVYMINPPSV